MYKQNFAKTMLSSPHKIVNINVEEIYDIIYHILEYINTFVMELLKQLNVELNKYREEINKWESVDREWTTKNIRLT